MEEVHRGVQHGVSADRIKALLPEDERENPLFFFTA
jgi:hypothetical protein